jgi:hypothetical protein
LIVSYLVLEHVSTPADFLKDIRDHLAPGGTLLLAVPDCTAEILVGDPGMLLHEHYYYYTERSLVNCLASAEFSSEVFRAGYGRLLYAVAKHDVGAAKRRAPVADAVSEQALNSYTSRCSEFINGARERIEASLERGSVGIYCPARALGILPHVEGMRFFDDSPSLHGKYYPPFTARVESREELLRDPPRELWIMSRTFGRKLRSELAADLTDVEFFLIDELSSD